MWAMFGPADLEKYRRRYDEIVAAGFEVLATAKSAAATGENDEIPILSSG
jgi:hypothetical protein